MKPLSLALQDDTDDALLPVLARFWKASILGLSRQDTAAALRAAMMDAARAETAWDGLTDEQRGAVQMLIATGGRMPASKFGRLYGEVRQMGAAQIEREDPLKNPASLAEALYYRGLVMQTIDSSEGAPRIVMYVPQEVANALPLKKTSYSNLQDEAPGAAPAEDDDALILEPLEQVSNVRPADTSAVDDLTALLAYVQLVLPAALDGGLAAEDRAALLPYLLKPAEDRLDFLVRVAMSAELLDIQQGRIATRRAEVRRWLSLPRAEQVRALAEGWRSSQHYADLWHAPGLYAEPGGQLDQYDPAVARGALLELVGELAPQQSWWSPAAFVEAVRESEPDYQRPNGDFDSLYIRDADGNYLTGIEHWDQVDGALLSFVLGGPLHWLSLLDHADGAARLTAYGRAFLGHAAWPAPPEAEEKIVVQPDGTLLVSRKVARVDRFQAARFTTWGKAGDPFVYHLDGAGIQRAAEQGITTAHIASFLGRAMGDAPLPPVVMRLLENWQAGPSAAVSLERLTVLRTTDEAILERILNTPATRRYLGARLGPMAVVVRGGQTAALQAALGEQGIQVEFYDGGE